MSYQHEEADLLLRRDQLQKRLAALQFDYAGGLAEDPSASMARRRAAGLSGVLAEAAAGDLAQVERRLKELRAMQLLGTPPV